MIPARMRVCVNLSARSGVGDIELTNCRRRGEQPSQHDRKLLACLSFLSCLLWFLACSAHADEHAHPLLANVDCYSWRPCRESHRFHPTSRRPACGSIGSMEFALKRTFAGELRGQRPLPCLPQSRGDAV